MSSLFPEVTRHFLHVFGVIYFVHDFGSEEGLDDVLKGDDAGEGAEFINGGGDMDAICDHGVKEIGEVLRAGDGVQRSLELAEWEVQLAMRVGLKNFHLEDKAGDVLDGFIIDGDAGEGHVTMEFHELAHRGASGEGENDDAWRGGITCEGVTKAEEVFDNAALSFLDRAFFLTHVRHCDEFRATEGSFLFSARDAAGDFLRDPDEGGHDAGEGGEHFPGERGELFPKDGPKRLRDNFREDEDEKGEDGGDEARGEWSISKDFHGLCAYARGTHGVGHGIENEDR